MIDRHIARLSVRHPLSDAEKDAVRGLVDVTRKVRAGETIIREGETLDHSVLLLSGFACRFKDSARGDRQISEINIAGDFVDLHGFTLKTLDHSIQALSDCSIALAPHKRITAAIEAYPRLGRLFWFSTNLDAAIHREWMLSLGTRSALERVAALFCELHVRLGLVGLARPDGFDLPLRQQDIGECMGMTPVHANRVLRQLREAKVATFASGVVRIVDRLRLRALAGFDDRYLYLKPDPL